MSKHPEQTKTGEKHDMKSLVRIRGRVAECDYLPAPIAAEAIGKLLQVQRMLEDHGYGQPVSRSAGQSVSQSEIRADKRTNGRTDKRNGNGHRRSA